MICLCFIFVPLATQKHWKLPIHAVMGCEVESVELGARGQSHRDNEHLSPNYLWLPPDGVLFLFGY